MLYVVWDDMQQAIKDKKVVQQKWMIPVSFEKYVDVMLKIDIPCRFAEAWLLEAGVRNIVVPNNKW